MPGAKPEILICDKLIIATSVASRPKMPDLDVSSFAGVHMHSVEFGKRHTEFLSKNIRNVTVIGGHKSALEAVGYCAEAGKTVDWLIRKDGGGTQWFLIARTPDGSSTAKPSTKRVHSIFSPSVYLPNRWTDRFLFSGRYWLGTWITNSLWKMLNNKLLSDYYTRSENAKKLKSNSHR